MLLIVSSLFLRGLYRLSEVKLGFDVAEILTFSVDADGGGIEAVDRFGFYRQVRSEISQLPGINELAMASNRLINHNVNTTEAIVQDPGNKEAKKLNMLFMRIDESFFRTMGTRLLMGRSFQRTDTDKSEPTMIINKTLALQAFGSANPLGESFDVDGTLLRVVGVCEDFKYDSLKTSKPVSLLSCRQFPKNDERMVYYVRSETSHSGLARSIQELMAQRYPEVPVSAVESMASIVHDNTGPERAAAYASAALSGLALLLCGIGLYGLMCAMVAGRKGELGLRLALGDTRRGLGMRIVKDVLWLSMIGVCGGGLIAVLGMPMLQPYIFGFTRIGWKTGSLSMGFILVVCLVSAWIPARRASKTNPMTVLQSE